MVTSSKNTRI